MELEVAYDTTNSIATVAELDVAFESLLAMRGDSLFSSSDVRDMSESPDDKLCSTNLETARLFKILNTRASTLHKKIHTIIENSKALNEFEKKHSIASTEFINLCMTYHNEQIDTFKNLTFNMGKEYIRLQMIMKHTMDIERAALEAELDTVTSRINKLRVLIKTGIEDIIKPDDMNKKMCPVCYDKEVCMVMIPCGHTYCDMCSGIEFRSKCPQCRATINSRVKMFFSI